MGVRNYEIQAGEVSFMVTKDTALLIQKAMYECETKYNDACFTLGECFGVHCWLTEFIQRKTSCNGYIETVDHKDQESFIAIVEALKTAKRLYIQKTSIRKKRDGITYSDLRIEEGVNAEQVLENKLLTDIFKDYLTDEGLRDEVIKRVQGTLDLISAHLRYRQEERCRLEVKRKELRVECQQKINQSYQAYLDKCKNHSL